MDQQKTHTKINSQLQTLFEQYVAARAAGDVGALQKLLGDDYVHFHGAGRIDDKASLIADSKTGRVKHLKREVSDLLIRTYGSTAAVITGRGRNSIVINDVPKQVELLFTAVWIRPSADTAAWQIVSWAGIHV